VPEAEQNADDAHRLGSGRTPGTAGWIQICGDHRRASEWSWLESGRYDCWLKGFEARGYQRLNGVSFRRTLNSSWNLRNYFIFERHELGLEGCFDNLGVQSRQAMLRFKASMSPACCRFTRLQRAQFGNQAITLNRRLSCG
jgi:hypothetical protein